MGRPWSVEDTQTLEDSWGNVSIKTIAKNLNRTETAINVRAIKLGLGAFLESGDYISYNQLIEALNVNCSYKDVSWIEKRGLPIKYKIVQNNRFKIIKINDFWKWAEKNKAFINWSKVERNALGKEPKWVDEWRKASSKDKVRFKTTKWTKYEDDLLKMLLSQKKYGHLEISKRIERSTGAITKRISDLGIKQNPIKETNHTNWTEGKIKELTTLIDRGYSYNLLSEYFNVSSKSVRGITYRLWGSEDLDKVINKIKENENE